MSNNISIVLVDDHTVVRNGLKSLIERMGNFIVTHQFDNGKRFIEQIPLAEKPDLVIMDLTMPEMDGKETTKWLKENNISYPVLILTLDTSEKTIIDLFKLGVRGYLPKSCTADVLKKAIEDVIDTGYYHNELLTQALTKEDSKPKSLDTNIQTLLTDREREFLQLVCDEHEYTYEQIADLMKVHRRTVDGYREAIFSKFNIKSKTGLVLFAIKYGVITTPGHA
ncbi:MAG: response regulator [Flavipsychrobacter sp.]